MFNWVNSDDVLVKNSLASIGQYCLTYDCVVGNVVNFDNCGNEWVTQTSNLSIDNLLLDKNKCVWHQLGVWLRTDIVKAVGGLDESFYYVMDFDLFVRYFMESTRNVFYLISRFRLHSASKSILSNFDKENGFYFEKSKVAIKLLDHPKYRDVSKILNRRWLWYHFINQPISANGIPPVGLIFNMLIDPKAKLTKYSMAVIFKKLGFR